MKGTVMRAGLIPLWRLPPNKLTIALKLRDCKYGSVDVQHWLLKLIKRHGKKSGDWYYTKSYKVTLTTTVFSMRC